VKNGMVNITRVTKNDDGEEIEPLMGIEKPDSPFYHANRRRRQYVNIRSVSYSCRTREKCANKSGEFASNMRAFLVGDPGFIQALTQKSKELSDNDYEALFNSVLRLEFSMSRAAYELMSDDRKKSIRATAAQFIAILTEEEFVEFMGLHVIASCKVRGYEKELFILKCLSRGLEPYWIARCCYHVSWPKSRAIPVDFDSVIRSISFSDIAVESNIEPDTTPLGSLYC
jgi:hypothetical protein